MELEAKDGAALYNNERSEDLVDICVLLIIRQLRLKNDV